MFAESRGKRSKRTRLAVALSLCLAVCPLAGCAFKANLLSLFHQDQPAALPPDASLSQIVRHINSQIAHVHAWRSTKVTIVGHGSGALPVRLQARIAVEEPRNFRLQVSAMGAKQADLGSNSERFWFWMRPGEPKRVFTARHDEISNVRQLPFEPHWVMEALGVVPMKEGELRLQRPTGETGSIVDLVTGFNLPGERSPRHVVRVDTQAGHIIAHELYNPSNQLIARAELSDYRPETAQGVMMPHQIRLDWPQFDFGLTMHLGEIEINPPSFPMAAWSMPTIEGYPALDLARLPQRPQQQQMANQSARGNMRAELPDQSRFDGGGAGADSIQKMSNEEAWVPDTVQNAGTGDHTPPHERWAPPFDDQPAQRAPQRRNWWQKMFGR